MTSSTTRTERYLSGSWSWGQCHHRGHRGHREDGTEGMILFRMGFEPIRPSGSLVLAAIRIPPGLELGSCFLCVLCVLCGEIVRSLRYRILSPIGVGAGSG